MLIQLWHASNLKPKQMTMSRSRANQHREPIRVSSNLSPSWACLEGADPWAEEAPVSSSLLDRMAEGGRWWVGDWSEEKQELSGLYVQKQSQSLAFFLPSFLCSKRPEVPSLPGAPEEQSQACQQTKLSRGSSELLALHNSAVLVRREPRVPLVIRWEGGGAGPGVRECNK